ncbi:hypothetical protein AAC387_Pa11g2223 [Persea americana]
MEVIEKLKVVELSQVSPPQGSGQKHLSLLPSSTLSTQTGEYKLYYIDGDSVSLTVTESTAQVFHQLVADNPKDTKEFHPLIPTLPTSPSLVALQVTILPYSGNSNGICLHHVAADGRSLAHFMKTRSSINKTGDLSSMASLLSYNRAVIKDPSALKKQIYMWCNFRVS